jgi:hypothetical protein
VHWVVRQSMPEINGSAAEAAVGLDSVRALPRAHPSPYPLPQGEGAFFFAAPRCFDTLALLQGRDQSLSRHRASRFKVG